jgi:hypothetical protein
MHAKTYPVLNSWSEVTSSASSPCSSSSAVTKCTSGKNLPKIENGSYHNTTTFTIKAYV